MLATRKAPRTAFTKENARAMQAKGVKFNKGRLKGQKPVVNLDQRADDYARHGNLSIQYVQASMNRIMFLMEGSRVAKTLDALSRVYERLFKIWAHLTQTGAPAPVRPEKMRRVFSAPGQSSLLSLRPTLEEQPTQHPTTIGNEIKKESLNLPEPDPSGHQPPGPPTVGEPRSSDTSSFNPSGVGGSSPGVGPSLGELDAASEESGEEVEELGEVELGDVSAGDMERMVSEMESKLGIQLRPESETEEGLGGS